MKNLFFRNSVLLIIGLASLASLQLLKLSSNDGSLNGAVSGTCSTSYCIDPKCVPASCPLKTLCSPGSSCGGIYTTFNSFLTSLQDRLAASPQYCTAQNSFLPDSSVKACLDPSIVKFSASSAAVNDPSIPPGAVIYSYRLVSVGGYWWMQIIYYYQGQYYYLMYNTGIIVTRRLASTMNAIPISAKSMGLVGVDLPNLFTRLQQVQISEWIVSSNLTTLLKCLPEVDQYKQINCMSKDNVAYILLVA